MQEPTFHSDPVSILTKPFDVALRCTVPNGAARQLVGLQGVSEKITGSPGWYLWFSDNPGAYLLELVTAEMRMQENRRADTRPDRFAGTYVIKYYPSCHDAKSLGSFSEFEQVLRQTEFFDSTGTPNIEFAEDFPESLFTIAGVEVESSSSGHELALRLVAPDHWITHVTETQQNPAGTDGMPLLTKKLGELDRNVPAWDLAWFLMDRLLKLLLFAYRVQPAAATFVQSADLLDRINSEATASLQPDGSTCLRRLNVLLRLFDGGFHGHGGSKRIDVEAAASLTGSHNALHSGASAETAVDTPEWISSEWWCVAEYAIPDMGIVHC